MNIVVCIKQVPDTKGGVKFNAEPTVAYKIYAYRHLFYTLQ